MQMLCKQLSLTAMVILFTVILLTACTSDELIITGKTLPPTNPSNMKIYTTPPASFREIAIIKAEISEQPETPFYSNTDRLLNKLKIVAARLGANGILVREARGNNRMTTGSDYGITSAYGRREEQVIRARSTSNHDGLHGVAIFVISEEDDI